MALHQGFTLKTMSYSVSFFSVTFHLFFYKTYRIRSKTKTSKWVMLHLIISFKNSCKNNTSSNYPGGDVISTFQNSQLSQI